MSCFLNSFSGPSTINAKIHPSFPVSGTPQEQEAFVTRYTTAIQKIREMNIKIQKEKVFTKRLVGQPEFVPRVVATTCQAVNLNNTPCKFKATCGRFCKKHKVSAKDLELV